MDTASNPVFIDIPIDSTSEHDPSTERTFEQALLEEEIDLLSCFDTESEALKAFASKNWRVDWGMAQGFMGSATHEDGDVKDNYIDAIRPVCVPWSSASWLDNWSWAKVSKEGIQGFSNFLSAIRMHTTFNVDYSYFRKVWLLLSNAYEVRKKEEGPYTVHPPSMKNCPPNYYLHGVNLIKSSSDKDQGIVYGIIELICHRHASNSSSLPEELILPLWAKENYNYLINHDNNAETVPYDISAMIGKNRITNSGYIVRDVCGKDGTTDFAVAALAISRDNNNLIDYFHLYCAPAPNGGTP